MGGLRAVTGRWKSGLGGGGQILTVTKRSEGAWRAQKAMQRNGQSLHALFLVST